MTLSNSYKRVMDRICLSDDVKENILKNATNNNRRKKAIWTRAVDVAACFAIAVFAVFVLTNNQKVIEKTPISVSPSENDESGKKVTDDSVKYEIKDMASFSELEEKVGYDIKKPEIIPDGYAECAWTLISGNTAEILYIGGGDILTYRTSKTDALQDEGVYEITENVTVSGVEAILRGTSENYLSASWTKDGENFLVTSICGLDRDTLIEIVKSTK